MSTKRQVNRRLSPEIADQWDRLAVQYGGHEEALARAFQALEEGPQPAASTDEPDYPHALRAAAAELERLRRLKRFAKPGAV